MSDVDVRQADWQHDLEALKCIRTQVFIQEQDVPPSLEWDDDDTAATHFIAFIDGLAVGTARLLGDGRIGRMAVLPDWRHRGVGSALLDEVMAVAGQRGDPAVRLDAQLHALGFYENHGFTAGGEVFMDAGIPHRRMYRSL